MDPFEFRKISDTDITVTCFGFGGASMGNMYTVAHDNDAMNAIHSAYEAGVRYFDTAPMYGFGKSERLYGSVLREMPRDSFVLSTKIGRLIAAGGPTPESEDTPFVEINNADTTRLDINIDTGIR